MRKRLVITEDVLTWFDGDDEAPIGEICLVRRRTGELVLVASIDLARVENLWMWAVIPPPPQFILEKETM